MAFHVVFPAAGVGRRFGGEYPKQYSQIQNKTIMEWTLSVFRSMPNLGRSVVAVQPDDHLAQALLKAFPHIDIVEGGGERSQSVLNALNHLALTENPDDWVLVHDIARPCVHQEDVLNLIETCQTSDLGGVLARPVTDTVKRQLPDGRIETLDRSQLWTVQTPQCFRLGDLIQALEHCEHNNLPVTDEASAVEAHGGHVQLVEGSSDNIKLTHASDLALIEFYLTKKGF